MEFTDISSPILDLLSPTIRDESIDSVEWSEYEPQEPNARKLLQLWVNNTDQYTLPCEAYLEIAGQLTKADGTLYAEGDKIAIVNNGIMALFGDARYKINGMTVESVDNNVGIATTVMGLARITSCGQRTQAKLRRRTQPLLTTTLDSRSDKNCCIATTATANSPRSSPSVTSLDSPETSGKSSTG